MIFRWLLLLTMGASLWAAELKPDEAREQAVAAWKAGKHREAVELVSKALNQHPKEGRLWHFRAQMRLLMKDGKGALHDLDEAVKLDDDSAFLRQERATLRFRAGLLQEAVSDFDKANELSPQLAPQNWQRGIALYYVGRYADGRKQFELHRTVNPEDVENAAWHFLCTARADGLEEAKKTLIGVKADRRVPMAEIQRLFAGEGTVDDVFAAARKEGTEGQPLQEREFYAHLYVGLHFEAHMRADEARRHIEDAARLAPADNYMGQVARIHAEQLKLAAAPVAPAAPKP